MIKVVRAHSTEGEMHVFSIVADDKGFQYVFGKGNEVFDSKARVARLMENVDRKKMDVDSYLRLASSGLSMYKYDAPILEDGTAAMAAKLEKLYIQKSIAAADQQANRNSELDVAGEGIQQIFLDYPNFMDQLENTDDVDDEAMTNLVLTTLGEIDPNGPNAWILDMVDGKELPEGTVRQVVFTTEDVQEDN